MRKPSRLLKRVQAKEKRKKKKKKEKPEKNERNQRRIISIKTATPDAIGGNRHVWHELALIIVNGNSKLRLA